MCRQKLGLGIFLILISHLSYAEVYKWVDENGQTRFSDKAPTQSIKAEIITLPTVQSSSVPPKVPDLSNAVPIEQAGVETQQMKMRRLSDAIEYDRLRRQAEKNNQQHNKNLQKSNCAAQDKLLRRYERSTILKTDKEGNKIVIPESERETAIKSVKQSLERLNPECSRAE